MKRFRSRRIAKSLVAVGIVLCALSVCARAQGRKEVAITIDDFPAHGELPPGMTRVDVARSMIRTLKKEHVPPTYGFINAKKLEWHPEDIEVLKVWREAGFPLGNHAYSHPNLTETDAEAFEKDIAANEETLKLLMGRKDWHWFRYPYLHEGETLGKRREIRRYLQQNGYKVAQVTLDFEDYAWNNPYARCSSKRDEASIAWLKTSYLDNLAEFVNLGEQMSQIVYGRPIKHVLLLHIGGFDSVMLPDLLELLRKEGYRFISLKDAEKDPAYRSDPDAALPHGGTLLEQMTEAKHLAYPKFPPKPMEKLNTICR
jgi:peptidoglycan-N-acetylglucosamine deacetylase